MQWLKLYLRHRGVVAAAALGILSVFCLVLFLYGYPLEGVLYAALLTLLFSLPLVVADLCVSFRRWRDIMQAASDPAPQPEQLPSSGTPAEAAYAILAGKLMEQNTAERLECDRRQEDATEYYTLWAHQIKTPIAALRLILESEHPQCASEMKDELFRIEQYVEMALNYLRLNSASTDYVFRKYELDELVRSVVRKYARQFIRRKLRLNYRPMNISVLTDEKWLCFVLEQVLSNALKYTSAGEISIYQEAPSTLVIQDTGMGIRPEDLPRVFEKGYTGLNGRTDKKSTGIGLYLCKRVCKNLGHTIEISSQVGSGTKVSLRLERQSMEIE